MDRASTRKTKLCNGLEEQIPPVAVKWLEAWDID